MENCPVGLSSVGQLFPERIPEMKSRFLQMGDPSVPRTEVLCPIPRRVSRVPLLVENLNHSVSKPKGVLPKYRGDCGLEMLDLFLIKDDPDLDHELSNQAGFFCGSPPVRSNNPLVNDEQFTKPTLTLDPVVNSCEAKQLFSRMERGTPSCGTSFGGSPKVRIEGFACGNPEPRRVLRAFA